MTARGLRVRIRPKNLHFEKSFYRDYFAPTQLKRFSAQAESRICRFRAAGPARVMPAKVASQKRTVIH